MCPKQSCFEAVDAAFHGDVTLSAHFMQHSDPAFCLQMPLRPSSICRISRCILSPLQTKECQIPNPTDAYIHLVVRQAESNMPKFFSTILPHTVILFSGWPLQNR